MILKSSIVFIGIILFIVLEGLFPKQKNNLKNKLHRLGKNIFFLVNKYWNYPNNYITDNHCGYSNRDSSLF